MKKEIIKKHKGMEVEGFIRTEYNRKKQIVIEHAIEYNDKDVIITAAIKLDRNDPKLKKLLLNMEEKQESPVITVFKKLEKETRHDIKYQENDADKIYDYPFDE